MRTIKVKKAVPVKFVLLLIIIVAVLLVYAFAPSLLFSFATMIYNGIIGVGLWLITPQFLIGIVIVGVIAVVITQRKYLFPKKYAVIASTTVAQPLQSQLSSADLFQKQAEQTEQKTEETA